MLPARYLDDYRSNRLPKRARPLARRPRAAARPRGRAAYLALWALTVLVAFTVTYRHAAITRLGYDIGELEAELAAFRRQNGERETTVASLGSPQRIQQLAQSRLGMVAAGRKVLVVAMEPQPPAGAGVPGEPVPGGAEAPGVLERIWRLVQRLAGVPAEAAVPGP